MDSLGAQLDQRLGRLPPTSLQAHAAQMTDPSRFRVDP
jgi:hypothetical protein